jgi:hypothetical protein
LIKELRSLSTSPKAMLTLHDLSPTNARYSDLLYHALQVPLEVLGLREPCDLERFQKGRGAALSEV